ncbi:MAG TPA: hypothetical protein VN766_12450 [Stellaceae bacterium]|jgi:hypothetical protein|nr:hypothetical protein [Stellaceae bacterium]
MKFRVTIKVAGEAIYHAVHEADGSEPALRAAMQAARRACPGKPVYLSDVTLEALEPAQAPTPR